MLQTIDGERRLTDLRHVGQLLHAAATAEQLGAAALTSWLRQQIAAAGEDTSDEERSRRLESDAEAVQVLTIHRSKGVEFPIVYYPYLWEPGWIPNDPQPVFFHDPDRRTTSATIDVGMDGPDFPAHRRQHEAEQRGEDLRLAYVALTRAQHQAVVWWAPSWDSRNSRARPPALRARRRRQRRRRRATRPRRTPQAVARFEGLALDALGCISVERATLGPADGVGGRAAHVQRSSPRRASTATSTGAGGARPTATSPPARYEARVASEPEERVVDDEETLATPPPAPAPSTTTSRRLRARRAVAARRRCRSASTSAPSCTASSRRPTSPRPTSTPSSATHVAATLARRRVDVGDPATTVAGLRAAIETPLGPLLGGRALRDLARADRLDELIFELPLVGGDQPTGRLTLAAIARRPARAPPGDDPLAGYAERLDDAEPAPEPARLSHRQHRPRRAQPTTASPSPTTRRTGSARPARS